MRNLNEDPVVKDLVIAPDQCSGNIDHEMYWVLNYGAVDHMDKLGGRVRQHKMGGRVSHTFLPQVFLVIDWI